MEPQWIKRGTTALVAAGFLLGLLIPSWRLELIHVFNLLVQGDLPGIRCYLLSFGLWAPFISGLMMILQAFISPIPSVLIFIANGALFGPVGGFLLSWFTSLLSGVLCYLTAGALGRPFVLALANEKFLTKIDTFLHTYGQKAVLFARLLPFMPFDLTSFAFGLTSISLRDFVMGTALGQIPAILFYSLLGTQDFELGIYVLWLLLWIITLIIATQFIGFLWQRSHTPTKHSR